MIGMEQVQKLLDGPVDIVVEIKTWVKNYSEPLQSLKGKGLEDTFCAQLQVHWTGAS